MYKFKFADIGEGLHEGTVGEIYVNINDKIEEGDSLFSVETDKVTSDIPAPVAGKINKILIKTGETVHVGEEIFYIDDGNSSDQQQTTVDKDENPTEKDEKAVIESQEANINDNKETNNAASVVGSITVSDEQMTTFETTNENLNIVKKIFATPYSRKLASENNVDLSMILGTGNNGRILAKDIESFIISQSSVSVASNFKVATNGTMLKPFSQPVTAMRQAIARAMNNSWSNVAYTNLSTEVNMTKLWEERKSLISYTEKKYGVRISFTALIALATIKALSDFQIFNCKYVASENALIHNGTINLGIAVDTPNGLIVPVIKNAHTKGIIEIAQSISSLATKAREKKLTKDDLNGGTFTLTNYGSVGAMVGTPVINYPEIAILGTGAIVDRVFQNERGDFYNGKVMYLTVAADHQWIDGADIGRFVAWIKELLEKPILLLGEI